MIKGRTSLNKDRRYFDCIVFNRILFVVDSEIHSGSVLNHMKKYDLVALVDKYDPIRTVERYNVVNDKWEFIASMKYKKDVQQMLLPDTIQFQMF